MIFWKWSKNEKCCKSYKNTNSNKTNNLKNNINENINKREYIDDKLSDRIMIAQINQNPFLQNLSYSEHLNNYDTNLKRSNTHCV